MRKYVLLSLGVLLAVFTARADDKSDALLRRLAAQIDSYPSYRVDFEARMDGEFGATPGSYVVSGDCYRIEVSGTEVYSDGRVRESYNPADDEVVIETADPADRTILANPTQVFRFLDGELTHVHAGTEPVNGRNCEVIRLAPRTPNEAYKSITLWIDAATGLPAKLSYRVGESSADVEVLIDRIVPGAKLPASQFRFDRSKHPSAEVIDFR